MAKVENHPDNDFEKFYGEHKDFVTRFVRRRVLDPDDADDLIADTITRALGAGVGWENVDKPKPWLATIARNVVTDHWRLSRGLPPLELDETLLGNEDAVGTSIDQFGLSDPLLRLAFEGLPQDQKDIIILAEIQERTPLEISNELGISHNAAKSRLHRARATLARAYRDASLPPLKEVKQPPQFLERETLPKRDVASVVGKQTPNSDRQPSTIDRLPRKTTVEIDSPEVLEIVELMSQHDGVSSTIRNHSRLGYLISKLPVEQRKMLRALLTNNTTNYGFKYETTMIAQSLQRSFLYLHHVDEVIATGGKPDEFRHWANYSVDYIVAQLHQRAIGDNKDPVFSRVDQIAGVYAPMIRQMVEENLTRADVVSRRLFPRIFEHIHGIGNCEVSRPTHIKAMNKYVNQLYDCLAKLGLFDPYYLHFHEDSQS